MLAVIRTGISMVRMNLLLRAPRNVPNTETCLVSFYKAQGKGGDIFTCEDMYLQYQKELIF